LKERIKVQKYYILSDKGAKLAALLFQIEKEASPLLIICHGFTGTKEGREGKYLKMAEWLKERGISSLLFDFYACNESEGNLHDLTLSQETEDLKNIVRFCRNLGFSSIHLFGRSLGGAIAIIYGAYDHQIKSISTWAAPADLKRLFLPLRGKEIYAYGKSFKLNDNFYREIEEYEPRRQVKEVSPPLLLLHSKKDDTVPYSEAEELFRTANKPKKITLFEDLDHELSYDYQKIWQPVAQWVEQWN